MGQRAIGALRFGVYAMLALLLASCATKFAYNHLDWAMNWKVKRLVKLDGEQKQYTAQAIDSFLDWHRATQLPQYAEYLAQVQQRIAKGGLSAADVSRESHRAQALIEQSLAQMMPDIVIVLSRLDQHHVDELLASIAEERDEYIDEHVDMSADEQVEKRYKKFEKHFKDWLGKPTRKQRKQIESWARNLETYESQTARQQAIWQQQLAELLAERKNVGALGQGLARLTFHRAESWDKEFKRITSDNEQRTYQLLADLLNNMTSKQRDHLYKEIDDYIQIFMELNKEAS